MAIPEPRQHLSQMIALTVLLAEKHCRHGIGPGPGGTVDACAPCIAKEVVGLFARLAAALADVVVKAVEHGEQDGGFVAFYLLPTGPIHRAIPLLQEMGVTVRPGSERRAPEPAEETP